MLSRTIERNFHAFITLENILRRGWGQNLFMKAERIKSKQCVSPSSPSSPYSAFYSLYVSERQAFAILTSFDKKKNFLLKILEDFQNHPAKTRNPFNHGFHFW